jgi:hypothetical protein
MSSTISWDFMNSNGVLPIKNNPFASRIAQIGLGGSDGNFYGWVYLFDGAISTLPSPLDLPPSDGGTPFPKRPGSPAPSLAQEFHCLAGVIGEYLNDLSSIGIAVGGHQ